MKTQQLLYLVVILLGGLTGGWSQPVIQTQPQSQEVPAGSAVTLGVHATGAESLSYQWYFNSPVNAIPGATNASLVINNVQVSDDGFYRVKVVNAEGYSWSTSARLVVLPPPSITLQPTNQVGKVGETRTFSVSVSGATPFSYQWRFNESNLAGETNDSLVLTNLQLNQAGSYTVVVTNISGSVTSQVATLGFWVTVNPPFVPELHIGRDLDQLRITWQGEGVLERAPSPSGPWTSVGATDGSFLISPEDAAGFFRVRNPHPRSVELFLPSSYNSGTQLPLVILLHGLTSSGIGHENYMRFLPLAHARNFLYCFPDGTLGTDGIRFWNATDSCCNLTGSTVDDVAFLRSLILEIRRTWDCDPKRVYLIGHSNGGFMSYRMACEQSDLIAGLASLAGATFLQSSDCRPAEPVNILQIHGTSDFAIGYQGGTFAGFAPFPGAMGTIQRWAGYNACADLETESAPSLDLDRGLSGLDTVVTRYRTSPPGGAVELWTIQNGSHNPNLSSDFSPLVVDWLLAHPKP